MSDRIGDERRREEMRVKGEVVLHQDCEIHLFFSAAPYQPFQSPVILWIRNHHQNRELYILCLLVSCGHSKKKFILE